MGTDGTLPSDPLALQLIELRDRERCFRELFEASPHPLFAEDWSKLKRYVDQLIAGGVTDIASFFAAHPEEVAKIPQLVEWVHINDAAVRAYGLSSARELIDYFKSNRQASFHMYPLCIERFMSGESYAEIENVDVTPSGSVIHLVETFRVPSGYTDDWSRIFAGVKDISALKNAERSLRDQEKRLREALAESDRLMKAKDKRAQELASLVSLSEALRRSMSAPELIRTAGDKVREIFAAEVTEILLYDESSGMIHTPYSFYKDYQTFDSFPFGEGLTSQIIRTSQPILSGTSKEQLGAIVLNDTDNTESYMGVALVANERTLGVISVQSYEQNAFNEHHLRLLQILSTGIGVAIENARLFDETKILLRETEARNGELAYVNGLQEALASGLKAEEIYTVIGEKIHQVFDTHVLDIGLYDEQAAVLHFPYTIERGVRFPDEPMPLVGYRKHVMETSQPLLLSGDMETARKQYANPKVRQGEVPKCCLFVSAHFPGKVPGVSIIKILRSPLIV
jgi:GAF domain-containing protein